VAEIRQAAAACGADAVLIISSVVDLDSYVNPLAVLYLTIVCAWLVPGSHVDALYLLEGVLMDVNNEYIYLSAESDGKGSTMAPAGLIDSKNAIQKAKKIAIQGLADEFAKRMRNLKGR
jgi:hypothetical protein